MGSRATADAPGRPQLTPEVQNQLDEVFFKQNRWVAPIGSLVAAALSATLLRDVMDSVAVLAWLIVGVAITIIRFVGNHLVSLHRWVDRRGTPWWTNIASGVVGAHFGSLAWIDPGSFREDDNWVLVCCLLLAMTAGGIVGLAGMAGNGRYALWSTWSLGVAALATAGQPLPAAGFLFMALYIARDLNATSSIMLETVFLRHQSQAQAELARQQALHDPLTGLLNRFGLDEATSDLTPTDPMTAMYIDLDSFKAVNDSCGHPTGDRLLAQVAGRLRRHVRPGDIVARLGGDEFMVLIADALDEPTSTRLANEIIADLETPFLVDEQLLSISASIGITVTSGRPFDLARLQAEADRALYVAKDSGRRQAVWFGAIAA